MSLQDAIAILRVRVGFWTLCCSVLMYLVGGRSNPSQCDHGTRDQGRYAERDDDTQGSSDLASGGETQSEETILVFTEGRQADEANRAGAHIVGGLELVDDVSTLLMWLCSYPVLHGLFLPRLSAGDAMRLPYSVFRVSFVQSLQNSVVCSAQEVLCLRRGEGR